MAFSICASEGDSARGVTTTFGFVAPPRGGVGPLIGLNLPDAWLSCHYRSSGDSPGRNGLAHLRGRIAFGRQGGTQYTKGQQGTESLHSRAGTLHLGATLRARRCRFADLVVAFFALHESHESPPLSASALYFGIWSRKLRINFTVHGAGQDVQGKPISRQLDCGLLRMARAEKWLIDDA